MPLYRSHVLPESLCDVFACEASPHFLRKVCHMLVTSVFFVLCPYFSVNSPGSTMPPKPQSSSLSSQDLATPAFQWLGLRKILWRDPTGEEREWEASYRKSRKGNLDGVTAICRIVHDQPDLDEVVLVSQFRPALGVLVREISVPS